MEPADTPLEALRNVYGFFGVADRSGWWEVWAGLAGLRDEKLFETAPGPLTACLRVGECRGRRGAVRSDEARRGPWPLAGDGSRPRWCGLDGAACPALLDEELAGSGVVVVLEPPFAGAPVRAASWRRPGQAAVVQLSSLRWTDEYGVGLLAGLDGLLRAGPGAITLHACP